jgi:predicted acetyltransferase
MDPRASELRVRPAEPRDQDRLLIIHEASYPDARSEGERWRRLTAAPWGTLQDLRVVEDEARGVIGHGFLFPLEMVLAGRRVPVGGIASIGVAPEARRQGIARTLLEALHTELAARRIPFAFLYPFRESFYERLGYVPTTRLAELDLSAASLARFEPPARAIALDGRHRDDVARLYESVAQGRAGWLVRNAAAWDARFCDERSHWVGLFQPDGALTGYVAFSYQGRNARGRGARIVVSDFVARTHEEARALLGFFGQQRDQVDRVELTVGTSDPLMCCALDGAAPGSADGQLLGSLRAGPMVRLNDVGSALAARGYASDGEMVIRVRPERDSGAPHPEPQQDLRLRVQDGRAVVEPCSEMPHLSVARGALGALLVSALSVEDAAHLGHVRAHVADAIPRLDSLLGSAPRFQCLDRF